MTRGAVVAEAITWIGTPFRPRARVKGVGCDCATFILEVMRACGIFTAEPEFYQMDWFANATEDRYYRAIIRHARQLPNEEREPLPGDIFLIRRAVGPQLNREQHWHGGIVVKWPEVVHAWQTGVQRSSAMTHPAIIASQGLSFFDPWKKP